MRKKCTIITNLWKWNKLYHCENYWFQTFFFRPKKGLTHIFFIFQNNSKFKYLVAAISFGTKYSGYVWISKYDFKACYGEYQRILSPPWKRKGGGIQYKAPSSVLFRPNKTVHSFGVDAEEYYTENPDCVDFREWYFFKHFGRKLYFDQVIFVSILAVLYIFEPLDFNCILL